MHLSSCKGIKEQGKEVLLWFESTVGKMSSLNQNIDSLTNEDIVNSLIEDFQNEISVKQQSPSRDSNVRMEKESKTSVNQEELFSKGPKIIELDNDEFEDNEKKKLFETNSSIGVESAPNNNMCGRLREEHRDVHQGVTLTEMDEKDGDAEDFPFDDDDEEDCGVDDSGLSQDEIKKLETKSIDLKNEGNELFKQSLWRESLSKYEEALRTAPRSCAHTRAVFFANKAAVFEKTNRSDASIRACTRALSLNENYVKVLLRRARLYRQADKLDEALEDYKKILQLEPRHSEALIAVQTLPSQINERNEKLKEEMLGKLKDLGNMILRPFGLSTNNFQMTQDLTTGGYSVNFNQGATPPSS